MKKKWFMRIGTKTTTRKKSAIRHARLGTMQTRHLQYVQTLYQAALFYPLRNILPESIPNQAVQDFAEECIDDAFTRVKQGEYNERYRFRTFLTNKVIFPALSEWLRSRQQERQTMKKYFITKWARNKFKKDFTYFVARRFTEDALRLLKKDNKVQYEIVCRHFYNNLPFDEIYKYIKDDYYLSITSESAVRVNYQRGLEKLKSYLRQTYRKGKYVDKLLPFNKGFLQRLRAETTKK